MKTFATLAAAKWVSDHACVVELPCFEQDSPLVCVDYFPISFFPQEASRRGIRGDEDTPNFVFPEEAVPTGLGAH